MKRPGFVAVVAVAAAVLVTMSGCAGGRPAPTDSPQYQFYVDATGDAGFGWDPALLSDDFNCLTLTPGDLESMLIPVRWMVEASDERACSFSSANGETYVSVTGANGPAIYSLQPEAWMQANWGGSFVYQFPASFGWGGALWTLEEPYVGLMPAAPDVNGNAWAELCSDADHCLEAVVPGNFYGLKDNVNGVYDQLGAAIELVELIWPRLVAQHPDWGFPPIPAVNPEPYQPLLTPVAMASTWPPYLDHQTGPTPTPTPGSGPS